jgi:uncharacterized SAM-binding protein YcdF (DUF218 family)
MIWLLCAAAITSLWQNRQDKRRRLAVLSIAFILLTMYCLPLTSYLLSAALESRHPPLNHRPSDIDGIVVLAGGLQSPQSEFLQFEPAENVRFRCIMAAAMYKQGPRCPVLVSGGSADLENGEPAGATVMKRVLIEQGVAAEDIVEETKSRSTYENAVECAQLLRYRDIRKALLVTDGLHLERASRCFQKEGVIVVGCGCNYRSNEFDWSLNALRPGPSAALGTRVALEELVRLAWYAIQGRI